MKYFKLFVDFAEVTEQLTDAELGRLIRAMMEYASSGESPDLRGNERYLWGAARSSIDQQSASYANKVGGAAKAREARSDISNNNSDIRVNQNDIKEKILISTQDKIRQEQDKTRQDKKKSIFVAPTVDEVREKCRENGYEYVDPDEFVSFYASKNCFVGKNKMTSWVQALSGWNTRARNRGDQKAGQTPGRIDKTANLKKLFAELGDD